MCRLTTVIVMVGAFSGSAVAGPAAVPFDLHAALRDAVPGATIRVPAGIYRGQFVIDKPVILLAEAGAILDGGGNGDIVLVRAADVTVRGFLIRNTGIDLDKENAGITVQAPRATIRDNVLTNVLFGIYVRGAPDCRVLGNLISGMDLDIARRGDGIRLWYSHNCVLEDNVVHDSRDSVMWFSDNVVLRRNRVIRSRYGLHFMYSHKGLLEDNHLEDNSVGTYMMYSRDSILRRNVMAHNRGPSGYGLGLKDVDNLLVEDNQFVGNRVGVYLDNSPQAFDVYNHVRRNAFAYNDIGVVFLPSVQRNLFSENAFQDNLEQVAIFGSGTLKNNSFTVDGRGNFWSDYAGYDADGNGVGDLPYRAQSLFENLMDRQPRLRLFLFSPAQQAIEMAAKAFPAVKPQPKIADAAPLMQPVPLAIAPVPRSSRWPMVVLALALLAAASLLASVARLANVSGAIPTRRMRSRDVAAATDSRLLATGHCNQESPMIRVANLGKQFGSFHALRDVSFQVAPGEAVALWGPNGAGKTTAIRCLLGLLHSEGTIRVNGYSLRKQGKQVRLSLGYVPQELHFYDDWRSDEFLRFCAQIKNVPLDRIAPALAEVGLEDHGRKRVGELSGGMKQRLALAAALLANPPLLVLDEITSNLDRAARDTLLALLAAQRQQGKTILFTSHRLDEVERLADRVLVLEAGRLLRDGKPHDLASEPGLQAHMKLFVAGPDIEPAVKVLRYHGFTARGNGVGVEVATRHDAKASPIQALLAAGIAVDNFELEEDVHAETPGATVRLAACAAQREVRS